MLKIEGYHLFDKRDFDSFNTIVMIYSYDSANQLLIPYNKKKQYIVGLNPEKARKDAKSKREKGKRKKSQSRDSKSRILSSISEYRRETNH